MMTEKDNLPLLRKKFPRGISKGRKEVNIMKVIRSAIPLMKTDRSYAIGMVMNRSWAKSGCTCC